MNSMPYSTVLRRQQMALAPHSESSVQSIEHQFGLSGRSTTGQVLAPRLPLQSPMVEHGLPTPNSLMLPAPQGWVQVTSLGISMVYLAAHCTGMHTEACLGPRGTHTPPSPHSPGIPKQYCNTKPRCPAAQAVDAGHCGLAVAVFGLAARLAQAAVVDGGAAAGGTDGDVAGIDC